MELNYTSLIRAENISSLQRSANKFWAVWKDRKQKHIWYDQSGVINAACRWRASLHPRRRLAFLGACHRGLFVRWTVRCTSKARDITLAVCRNTAPSLGVTRRETIWEYSPPNVTLFTWATLWLVETRQTETRHAWCVICSAEQGCGGLVLLEVIGSLALY